MAEREEECYPYFQHYYTDMRGGHGVSRIIKFENSSFLWERYVIEWTSEAFWTW